jgi:hypothetical protein
MGSMIDLADGRSVPAKAVAALDALEREWPGATLPEARPVVAATVIEAVEPAGSRLRAWVLWLLVFTILASWVATLVYVVAYAPPMG